MTSSAAYWRRICAVCGKPGQLHEHHLVPRAAGGQPLPTVMLCTHHHGLVHGISFPAAHSELTIAGLARARARGTKLGNPDLRPGLTSEMGRKGNATRTRYADMHLASVWPAIERAQAEGARSMSQLAAALEAAGVRPPRAKGGWHPAQVWRLLKRRAALSEG